MEKRSIIDGTHALGLYVGIWRTWFEIREDTGAVTGFMGYGYRVVLMRKVRAAGYVSLICTGDQSGGRSF